MVDEFVSFLNFFLLQLQNEMPWSGKEGRKGHSQKLGTLKTPNMIPDSQSSHH
jgi:hypothetical protein